MGDITVYVPDAIEARARAYGIPLSRAMRAILLATLDVVQDRMLVPSFDPVASVVELMRDEGLTPQDHGDNSPPAEDRRDG